MQNGSNNKITKMFLELYFKLQLHDAIYRL